MRVCRECDQMLIRPSPNPGLRPAETGRRPLEAEFAADIVFSRGTIHQKGPERSRARVHMGNLGLMCLLDIVGAIFLIVMVLYYWQACHHNSKEDPNPIARPALGRSAYPT
jgi:hypothetical protein